MKIRSALGGVLVLAVTLVAACNASEPGSRVNQATKKAVYISVDEESIEQKVLGALYQRSFEANGRTAVLHLDTSRGTSRIDRIAEGSADIIVGCTGELLTELDPALAEELVEGFSEDEGPNSGERREATFDALMGVLPGMMDASNPSNAQGCGDIDQAEVAPGLPQNIIPVYRKPVLDRGERNILNAVAGTISTSDLAELREDVEATGSVGDVVDEYMQSVGLYS